MVGGTRSLRGNVRISTDAINAYGADSLTSGRGGFAVTFPATDVVDSTSASASTSTRTLAETLNSSHTISQSLPLYAEQVLMLVEEFQLEIPYVEMEDIQDRSKADAFTKFFAIAQSCWLIVQCIARAHQGLRNSLPKQYHSMTRA